VKEKIDADDQRTLTNEEDCGTRIENPGLYPRLLRESHMK